MESKHFKIESDFKYKGYRCVVIFQKYGHRCGYVGVDDNNIFFGKQYNDEININGTTSYIEYILNVHGSLTYSASGTHPVKSDTPLWWLGFDCAHYTDGLDFESVKKYFGKKEYNIVKTHHMSLDGCVKSLEYVKNECKNLVNQIIKYNNIK